MWSWSAGSPGGDVRHPSAALQGGTLLKMVGGEERRRRGTAGTLRADGGSGLAYLSVSVHGSQGAAFLLMRHTERESGVTEGQHQGRLHQRHHQNHTNFKFSQSEGTSSCQTGMGYVAVSAPFRPKWLCSQSVPACRWRRLTERHRRPGDTCYRRDSC